MPSSPQLAILRLVSAGLHRLPGASSLESPSKSRTPIISKVDRIPKIEVYDSTERGNKTDGISLLIIHNQYSLDAMQLSDNIHYETK